MLSLAPALQHQETAVSTESFALGTNRAPDVVTNRSVWRLSDLADTQFHLPYFTNNACPRPRQVICIGEPASAAWNDLGPRTLYVADLDANEFRRVSPPVEVRDRWQAICGLAVPRDQDRAFWALPDRVLAVDLATGQTEQLYRCPRGWRMSQGNCTWAGDVYAIGETRADFNHKDGYTCDAEAHAWPQQPVGRIVLIDTVNGKNEVVHETNGLPTHVNVHPRDRNLNENALGGPVDSATVVNHATVSRTVNRIASHIIIPIVQLFRTNRFPHDLHQSHLKSNLAKG